MYCKHIKFEDLDGNPVEGDYYFNMTKAELLKLELSTNGGWEAKMKKLLETRNQAELVRIFDELLLDSYGVRSDDGLRFIKSPELSARFKQTGAYDELFTELVTNEEAALEFFKKVIPNVPEGPKSLAPAK